MSDLDLDAELLALAGGEDGVDSSTLAGEPAQTPTPQPSPKHAPESKPAATSQPRKGVAQKKTMKSSRGGARRRRRDDSEGEGEGSSAASDVDSLGSGAMEESDSEADAPGEPDVDTDLFPIEGMYKSDKDKADIMALPEIEREQILADREDEALKRRQDEQLKALLKRSEETQKLASKGTKRNAGAADLDDSPRRTSRAKTKTTSAVDAFKTKREADLKERERNAQHRKRRSPSPISSETSQARDRVEEDRAPELKDFERLRIGRTNFFKNGFDPGFEDKTTGCFARVNIGPAPGDASQQVYRMTQIKGYTQGEPYNLSGPDGKELMTDRYVILVHGKAERRWKFNYCSDGKFRNDEYERWCSVMATENLPLPTKAAVAHSCSGLHDLLNHQWTDADIEAKVAKQRQFAHLSGKPTNYFNSNYSNNTGSLLPVARANLTQADRLLALNQANRKKNLQEVRSAQIQERRKAMVARAAAAAQAAEREKAEAEAAAARAALQVPNSNTDDLFGSDISRSNSPAPGSGISTPRRTGTPLGRKMAERKEKKAQGAGLPTFRKNPTDDEVIGALELEIDEDLGIDDDFKI